MPARDYQASVELFKNGDVLLAWFGGLTGVRRATRRIPATNEDYEGIRQVAIGLGMLR